MRPRPGSSGTRRLAGVLGAAVVLSSAACASSASQPAEPDPATDKLAQVIDRGTLVLSTDLDYAPQSYALEDARRLTDTRCAPDELTGPEVTGFDAETAKLVAERLGVEPCFVAPSWVEITSGSWGDRWDLSIGSGAIEQSRIGALAFTRPYYVMPARAFVAKASPVVAVVELSGKRVGACASCTHEQYLRGTLALTGDEPIDPQIDDAEVVTYAVEQPGLVDVSRGEIDAFVCAEQVGARAIAEGLALRPLEDPPLFVEHGTAWADRGSELDTEAFVQRVDQIVGELHADGSLRRLSHQFFDADYASPAADFDMSTVEQQP